MKARAWLRFLLCRKKRGGKITRKETRNEGIGRKAYLAAAQEERVEGQA